MRRDGDTLFWSAPDSPTSLADPEAMLVRREENYRVLGYHLGIPGRILEMDPQELARFLADARTGVLWQDDSSTRPDGVPGRR